MNLESFKEMYFIYDKVDMLYESDYSTKYKWLLC